MLENNVPLIIHNTYVWILAEFGIVGFLSYLTALAMICNEILKLFKSPFTTRSGILLLLLVINFLLYSLAHEMLYQRVHWFLIAYVLTHSFRPLVTTNCSIK